VRMSESPDRRSEPTGMEEERHEPGLVHPFCQEPRRSIVYHALAPHRRQNITRPTAAWAFYRAVVTVVTQPDVGGDQQTKRLECRRVNLFAELEKSPEHIHTYKISPLSLWNAASAGHNAEEMLERLSRFSKYEMRYSWSSSISSLAGS